MKRLGNQTLELDNSCYIIGRGALVGEKEKTGTYKHYMKNAVDDDKMGEKTFEKGERRMLAVVNRKAIRDAGLKPDDIDIYLGGDLMNQLVSSNYVAELLQVPFVGIYSACATITASIGMASCLIDSGGFDNVLCSAISHFSAAERQYRYPLEFGNQRQCYSQWTVTGGAGFVLSKEKSPVKITKVCFGRVQDYGVVDIANMGAAMAPAIAIIGLCGMILPRISNTKIYSKGGKYSINNVCEIQLGSQQNILLTFYYRIKIQII